MITPITPKPKRMLVEGIDDLHSVAGLMRHHVTWPDNIEDVPVWIELGGSADEILDPTNISIRVKSREVQTLGVMFDADGKLNQRYTRFCTVCHDTFPNLPTAIPKEGLVAQNTDGKRIGLWVMPDNTSAGDLEVFLRYLVPSGVEPLWDCAMQSFEQSLKVGCRCRDCHRRKAILYTFLAWQDPPGCSPGIALTRKILDPSTAYAGPFVKWFRKLYEL